MKAQVLLTNILAVAAISAIANEQPNGVTPFDNLKTTQAKSFSATASDTSDTTSECVVTKADGKVTIADSYYVVESELTDTTFPLVVNPSEQIKKTEIEDFDVTFKASFVDAFDLTNAEVGGAQIGFALTSATSASYYCPGANPAWVALTKATDSSDLSVTEDTECTLHVDYDGRENKARFTIGTFKSEWVSVGAVENNIMAVLGSGSVKSLAGATYDIEAEVVEAEIPNQGKVKLELTKEQMAIADKLPNADPANPASVVNALFAENSANNQSEIANLVLFGKVGSDITATDKLRVEGVTKTTDAAKIGVKFGNNFKPQTVTGATVQYKLMGWNAAGAPPAWEQIGGAQGTDKFEFAPGGYRKFKIVAEITYAAAPAAL